MKGNIGLMIITCSKRRCLDFIVSRHKWGRNTNASWLCILFRGGGATGFHVAGGWANEDRFQLCGTEA